MKTRTSSAPRACSLATVVEVVPPLREEPKGVALRRAERPRLPADAAREATDSAPLLRLWLGQAG